LDFGRIGSPIFWFVVNPPCKGPPPSPFFLFFFFSTTCPPGLHDLSVFTPHNDAGLQRRGNFAPEFRIKVPSEIEPYGKASARPECAPPRTRTSNRGKADREIGWPRLSIPASPRATCAAFPSSSARRVRSRIRARCGREGGAPQETSFDDQNFPVRAMPRTARLNVLPNLGHLSPISLRGPLKFAAVFLPHALTRPHIARRIFEVARDRLGRDFSGPG